MKNVITLFLLCLVAGLYGQKSAMTILGKGYLSGTCGDLVISAVIGTSPINGIYSCGDQTFFIGFPDEIDLITTPITSEPLLPNSLIYPNPAEGLVYIKSEIGSTGLKILDFNGSLVKQYQVLPAQVNVSDWPSGLYVFLVTYQNGSYETIKIIKI